ncbi:MAG: protein kinase domain-containing protein, partial [Acidobacteriota bacterium]
MLANGQQFGDYRILSALGAGGMGEVYLAEDARLRRRVALKVLPQADLGDDRSRKRLIREARAAAALDHPNICTIYEVGEADGQGFIAMQYVEGETLAARLKRGPLDLPTVLAFAVQVAAALAEAHNRGIVHRDVKPQNIMLTAGNQVKVLDFGLAQLMPGVEGETRTRTVITEVGTVAGTAPYMSPEQVRGDALDARSDVFSFGCVLYEMAAGISPFFSTTAADTMSAVLTRAPAALPVVTATPELQRIVSKCLEKDREQRYQTTRDLAIDLEKVRNELVTGPRPPETHRKKSSLVFRRATIAAIALLLAAAATAYFYVRSDRPLRLSPDDFIQITGFADTASAPALSPDGRMVAFIRGEEFLGTGQIYVKLLPNGDPVLLTNDPKPKYGLTFTPDGSRVAYTGIERPGAPSSSWDTWTVPVLGGQSTRLLPNAAGLTWIDPHHVLFSEIEPGTGLHMGIVTASEDRQGERRIYFPAEARAMAHFSHLSPDRHWVLIAEMDRTGLFQPCRLVPFDGTSTGRLVGPNGACTAAAWSPDGRWMYFSVNVGGANHLWRQKFPDGTPSQVTSGTTTEEHGSAMAPDGRSIITSVGQSLTSLWIHDNNGDRLLPFDGSVDAPRVSRDGTHVYCLVQRISDPISYGLTLVDLASGKTDRILTEFAIVDFDISRNDQFAAFTVAAGRQKREIWLAALDRRSPPRRVAGDGDEVHFGRAGELVYRSLTGTKNVLMRIPTTGGRPVRISDQSVIDLGDVSPDGEWAIAGGPAPNESGPVTYALPVHGGASRVLCDMICPIKWVPAGDAVYMGLAESGTSARLIRYPLQSGQVLPDFSLVVRDARERTAPFWNGVAAGPDPSMYLFTKTEQRGNLFRVPL